MWKRSSQYERAGDQEALHLVAPEVVDQRVPVLVEALARVLACS
jgi:hypothetical protein